MEYRKFGKRSSTYTFMYSSANFDRSGRTPVQPQEIDPKVAVLSAFIGTMGEYQTELPEVQSREGKGPNFWTN